MTKLTGQVTTHVSDDVSRAMSGLAAMAGQSLSEYLRDLIETHVSEKRREYESMSEIFGAGSSISSFGAGMDE